MKRFTLAALAAFAALAAASEARAQNTYPYLPPQYGPYYQTPLSPYLNFLRGGDPAANYFLGVLPEFQRRENANQFRAQIGNLQILTAPLRNPLTEPPEITRIPKKLGPAGHPTAFGYTGTFFGTGQPGTGAPQRGQAARPPVGAPFTR
jgi:hypothetical protein